MACICLENDWWSIQYCLASCVQCAKTLKKLRSWLSFRLWTDWCQQATSPQGYLRLGLPLLFSWWVLGGLQIVILILLQLTGSSPKRFGQGGHDKPFRLSASTAHIVFLIPNQMPAQTLQGCPKRRIFAQSLLKPFLQNGGIKLLQEIL